MFRKHSPIFAGLLLLCAIFSAQAQPMLPEPFQLGRDYFALPQPISPRDPKKIEVMEIFRYGCIHCYRFDPIVTKWKKTLAQDVDFYPLPVVWDAETELQARALFTAQAFGIGDKIHEALFNAIWSAPGAPAPLNSASRIKQLFLNEKIDADKFDKTFEKSPAINARLKEAKLRVQACKIEGTPEIVVAGKYRITGSAFRGASEQDAFAKMLVVADYLVAKERKELPAKAGK
ncbi:MAG: thiol:disulfide interchange protein DsbA/DsbL [Spongiibacteraceae bacterium]